MVSGKSFRELRNKYNDLVAELEESKRALASSRNRNGVLVDENRILAGANSDLTRRVDLLAADLSDAYDKIAVNVPRKGSTIPPPIEEGTANFLRALSSSSRDPLVLNEKRELQINMSRANEDNIYKGLYGKSSKILISPTELSLEKFIDLKDDNVLKCDGLVQFKKRYLVMEDAIPITTHFRHKFGDYLKETQVQDRCRKSWMAYCGNDILNACWDVSMGWKYLNDKGLSCGGDMRDLIFIREDGRGVLMPRVKSTPNATGDFKSFIKIIKSVINLQADGLEITEDDSISYPLRRLIWSASYEGITDAWLFDSPLIWSAQKTAFFILSVDHLLKRDADFSLKMSLVLDPLTQSPSDEEAAWVEAVRGHPKIYKVLKTSASGLASEKTSGYRTNLSRIRFARNVLLHFIHLNVNLSNILDELESIFPYITIDMFYAICETRRAKYILASETPEKAEEKFLKWTSKGGIFYENPSRKICSEISGEVNQ